MKKILVIIFLFFYVPLFAQTTAEVDLIQLIREIQIMKKDNNRLQLVWWVPDAYWDISFKQSNTVNAETAEAIKDALKDYVFICVADMVTNGAAGFVYKDDAEIRKQLWLKDADNKKYYPLADSEISANALSIRSFLKPFLAKTMGQIGAGISIYLFKVPDEKGNNMINPYKKYYFSVQLADNSFDWKLPLPSLLAPRFCPVDNETMKGNWEYCPIHGAKLKH